MSLSQVGLSIQVFLSYTNLGGTQKAWFVRLALPHTDEADTGPQRRRRSFLSSGEGDHRRNEKFVAATGSIPVHQLQGAEDRDDACRRRTSQLSRRTAPRRRDVPARLRHPAREPFASEIVIPSLRGLPQSLALQLDRVTASLGPRRRRISPSRGRSRRPGEIPMARSTRCAAGADACASAGLVAAVRRSPHSEGVSVTGRFVYRRAPSRRCTAATLRDFVSGGSRRSSATPSSDSSSRSS